MQVHTHLKVHTDQHTMEFPTLFGEASTGKRKVYNIKVVEKRTASGAVYGTIVKEYGYEDGKKQINEKDIYEGKNIGRSNETTALEQAISEARNSWQKKRSEGYKPEDEEEGSEAASAGAGPSRHKAIAEEVPAPMLAHDFNKRGHNITFPCYVQRKYDGTRCVAVPSVVTNSAGQSERHCGLFSRNRKAYPNLDHIKAELAVLPPSLILDGELYSDELTFQDIVGMVKRESLNAGDEVKQLKVQFHVYDIISDAPYEERLGRLQALMAAYKFRYIKLVKTEVAAAKEDIKRLHAAYVAEGYEGIMLRNATGLYKVGNRSADLQKYKEFLDTEYPVTGFKEGEGAEAGCVIWLCKTPEGREFACRPRGTRESRQELFLDGASYVGKPLTVRYQELTDEGLPRFPVGIAFRDYE
jgi:ATP-dependent DNA ligase